MESELTPKKRQAMELELLGMILTDTSKAVYARNERMVEACDDWEEFVENRDIEKSQLPGTIRGLRITKVKKSGADMAILTIEYQGFAQEVAIFTKQWQQYKDQLKELTTGIFTLKKNDRGVSLERVSILK
jgi:DNA polymerase III alpha subunit